MVGTDGVMGESKHEKFQRIATARTNRAAEYIRLVAKLSNRKAYDYTDADVRQMFSFLEGELKAAREKFNQGSSRKDTFSFRG